MKPTIYVFCGPPCAGKTTAAREFADRHKLLHLPNDGLYQLYFDQERSAANIRRSRHAAYQTMHVLAEAIAANGHSVVLDATYAERDKRLALANVALGTGADFIVLECVVDGEIAAKRYQARLAEESKPCPTTSPTDLCEGLIRSGARAYPYSPLAHRLIASEVHTNPNLEVVEVKTMVSWLIPWLEVKRENLQALSPRHYEAWVACGQR